MYLGKRDVEYKKAYINAVKIEMNRKLCTSNKKSIQGLKILRS
jgi:hypothetical protein